MKIDRYAVFGHPISHSKSPRIHALFAQQTGEDIDYTAQDVPAERFAGQLKEFVDGGGKGLSCTVPLKELAWRVADENSGRADRAKAVNTLAVGRDGRLYGDNTDGAGLLRDLTVNLGVSFAGREVLLLGAGGASRGILGPLLDGKPHRLVIANRTLAKAETLAGEFSGLGPVSAVSFESLAGHSFDLILNATAASLSGDLPPLPVGVLSRGGGLLRSGLWEPAYALCALGQGGGRRAKRGWHRHVGGASGGGVFPLARQATANPRCHRIAQGRNHSCSLTVNRIPP